MSVINTNISSLNAQNNLGRSQSALQTSLERLSTGLRINSAKDDAAGLQIANRLTSQINGINVAIRNANDGISLAQSAEGAMQETTNILQRMRDLSVQAANGTLGDSERLALNDEVVQLKNELDRISTTTRFGSKDLFDGSLAENIQIGANANQTISVKIDSFRTTDLGTRASRDATAASLSATNNIGTLTIDSGKPSTLAAEDPFTTDVVIAAGSASLTTPTNVLTIEGLGLSSPLVVTIDPDTYSAGTAGGSGNNLDDLLTSINDDLEGKLIAEFDEDNKLVLRELEGDGFSGEGFTISGTPASQLFGASVTSSIGTAGINNTSFDINVNGASDPVTIEIDAGTYTTLESLADNINQKITETGFSGDVRATVDQGKLQFVTTDKGGDASITITATENLANGFTNLGFSTVDEANSATGVSEGAQDRSVEQIDIGTVQGAQDAIATIDAALAEVDSTRAALGAVQNRFESTISNLANVAENATAARSRIQDADFAVETANLTRNQILQQAGTSILAQANTLPQSVLSLLQ